MISHSHPENKDHFQIVHIFNSRESSKGTKRQKKKNPETVPYPWTLTFSIQPTNDLRAHHGTRVQEWLRGMDSSEPLKRDICMHGFSEFFQTAPCRACTYPALAPTTSGVLLEQTDDVKDGNTVKLGCYPLSHDFITLRHQRPHGGKEPCPHPRSH